MKFEKDMKWCLQQFDGGNVGKIGLFKLQAQQMSICSQHLFIRDLDL